MPSATSNENTANAKSEDILKNAMKELNISLKDKQKLLKANVKTLRETNTEFEKSTKITKKISDGIKSLNKELTSLKDTVKSIVGLGAILNFAETAKTMIKFNSELHRTVINAGKGKKELETYKNMVTDLGLSMGATHEQANKVVNTLAKLQYAGTKEDIKGAAEASYGLARAFNIDYIEVTQNTVELQKWGQISAKTTAAMYADTMKVAQANGLTDTAVKRIIKSTTNWSGTLKAFGKSAMDVQRYNMSLSKSVSALEKVGISADAAIDKIEKLMDPTNIEDNIPAYAALGISITDAIAGNIDPERMASGLKDFGEKLKQMGPIAGAQYAKAMGIEYKDAIKAASADMAEASKVDMTPEEKSAEAIKQLTENTKDFTEKVQDGVQKFGAGIRSLGPKILLLLPIFFAVIKKVFKKIFEERKKQKEQIRETVNEWMTAEEKKATMSERQLKKEEKERKKSDKKIEAEKIKLEKNLLKNLRKAHILANSQEWKDQVRLLTKIHNYEKYADLEQLKEQEKIQIKAQEDLEKKKAQLIEKHARAKTAIMKNELSKEIGALKEQLEKAKASLSDTQGKIKTKEGDIGNEEKAQGERLIKLGFSQEAEGKLSGIIGKLGGVAEKVKNFDFGDFKKAFATGTGNFISKLLGGLGPIGRAIGAVASGIAKTAKIIIKGIGTAVKKIFGFLKGTLGKVLGAVGGLAIVGMLMSKIMSKVSEPLEGILDSVVNCLEPVFDTIVPILSNLMSTLVKALMPPILKLLAGLLKMFSPFIKMIAGIFKMLEKIPVIGSALKGVGDALESVASDEFTDSLLKAADNVANTNHEVAKKTEENTEAMSCKEQITVNNGKVSVSKAQGSTSSSESSSSGGTNNSSASKAESGVASQDNLISETNKAMNKNNKELMDIKNLISNYFANNAGKKENKAMDIRAGIQQAFNISSGEAIPVVIDPSSFERAGAPDATSLFKSKINGMQDLVHSNVNSNGHGGSSGGGL